MGVDVSSAWATRLSFAHSLKTKLQAGVLAVWLLTLAIVVVLYVTARTAEESARIAASADDEALALLGFALATYRYVDEAGRSIGDAHASEHAGHRDFQQRLARVTAQPTSPLDWNALRAASERLNEQIENAERLGAAGKLEEAQHAYARARSSVFEQGLLPWFDRALSQEHSYASKLERNAIQSATQMSELGDALALGLALLGVGVLWAAQRVLMRPIGLLVAGTDAIARGDYTHRLNYQSNNELGILARRFDDMAATIETSQQTLVEKNQGLEQAYQLQGEFLSMMSHELRSPLHSVLGYTELVLDDAESLTKTSQHNIDNIALCARRLLVLIDDILDFSKLRSGHMRFRLERFSLSQLATEVITEARALATGRELDVRLELGAEAKISAMYSDSLKVRQILTNLLSNAVKFCERGHVTLSIERQSDERVRFVVTDTGIGIPEAHFTRIFEPFKQVQGPAGQAEGGTGLGLAIVSRLCALLGGDVRVESRVGEGSKFTVCLPINAERLHGQHTSP